jgi:cysteine desulfurase/selenocysteine lyase
MRCRGGDAARHRRSAAVLTIQPVQRISLDNAATSWPKPPEVYEAVDRYQREVGIAVGRGATARGVALQKTVDRCRARAARLLGGASARQVVFTFNGTDALNLALHGVLRRGDHVVTTAVEHNSVLRPLRRLQATCGVETTYVGPSAEGIVTASDVEAALRPNTRLVAISHVSNVTGAIQPVEDVVAAARRRGVFTLIDAAQSAGHLPINMAELGADLLACSGHKGLLGPLGTGLLLLRPGIEEQLDSARQGGTGTQSEVDEQPSTLPEKYEAGNHNAPGLVGLEAALEWIERKTVEAIRAHEQALTARLWEGLRGVGGVALYGPREAERRCGVVSFALEGFAPQEVAAVLDEQFGIESRAGLHCAPRMHQTLGTFESGGTVRLSPGPFTTEDEIDAAVDAVRQLADE